VIVCDQFDSLREPILVRGGDQVQSDFSGGVSLYFGRSLVALPVREVNAV